jgi:uracil-DNA glycosylase family protein
MLVGEVPGDVEDREGQPFVGPAGRLLMTLLSEAGIDRRNVYVTNAVKHFSWTERGTRRLHKKPRWSEIQACKPWLQAEILAVTPRLIVALGAVAAQSLLGADFRITKNRGRVVPSDFDVPIVPTYHPSAVLRAPDSDRRDELRRDLLSDLVVAEQFVRLPALAGTSHER